MNEPASSSLGPFGVRSVSPKAAFRRIGFIAARKNLANLIASMSQGKHVTRTGVFNIWLCDAR